MRLACRVQRPRRNNLLQGRRFPPCRHSKVRDREDAITKHASRVRSSESAHSLLGSTVHSRVMKQILLRIPAVFAKISFAELVKSPRGHFLSARKIMLPQHALDP